jgi:Bacterial PH domain
VDELTPRRIPTLRFGPDRRITGLAVLAAAVAVALVLTSSDGPSRLIFALAAVILAGYAVGDWVYWPRLTADAAGLHIRTPMTRADLAWADVEDVRADVRSRYGLRSSTLEVDAGDVLVVFSRRALGADPETVQNQVRAFDPGRWPAA